METKIISSAAILVTLACMVNAYGSNTVLGAQRGRTAFSGPIRVNTFRGHNDRFGSNVGRSSHHLSPITNPGFQTAAVNGGAYQTPVSNNAVYRPAANNAVYQGNQNTNVYRGQTQFQDPRLATGFWWAAWGNYESCSASCGWGEQRRFRTCESATGVVSVNNGQCVGSNYSRRRCYAGTQCFGNNAFSGNRFQQQATANVYRPSVQRQQPFRAVPSYRAPVTSFGTAASSYRAPVTRFAPAPAY